MSNRSYNQSASKERYVKKQLEQAGWYCVRAAGSHGVADILAVRPMPVLCAEANHMLTRLIQVKCSKETERFTLDYAVVDTAAGPMNLEIWRFPWNPRKGAA